MISRDQDYQIISNNLKNNPVTALLGPRQSGKTTLAKLFKANEYFDLENPQDLNRLENPQLTLEACEGLIVIDEIQRKPDLFPLLRYMVDNFPKQKYLILGSASQALIKQSSESLAGRISYYTLMGFWKEDIPPAKIKSLWLRGGLPRSYLARDEKVSYEWRLDYIKTFLEKDIPNLGIRIGANTLRRFWQMTSYYHGNIINFSELARSFGVSDHTIRNYIDILQGTFLIRMVQPWYANVSKRLVKQPKLYFRDSGLYHALLSIEQFKELESHAKLGASWEGFAMESAIKSIGLRDEEVYFWATHSGAELDLYWQRQGKAWGCEFKYTGVPKITKSMISALETLELEKIWIIYPGKKQYKIHDQIEVLPIQNVPMEWVYE